jgi:hypothetical protein
MDLLIVAKVTFAEAFVSYAREAHYCALETACRQGILAR